MSDLPLQIQARLLRVFGPGLLVSHDEGEWEPFPDTEADATPAKEVGVRAMKKMKADLRKERTARTRERNKKLRSVGIEPSDFMRMVKNNHLATTEEFDMIILRYLELDPDDRAAFAKGKGADKTASPANAPKPNTNKEGVSMSDITIDDLATVVKDINARLSKLEAQPVQANPDATPRIRSAALVEFAEANPGLIGDDAPAVDGFIGTTDVHVYDVQGREDTYTDRDTGLDGFWVVSKKGKKFLVDKLGVPFFLNNPLREQAYAK